MCCYSVATSAKISYSYSLYICQDSILGAPNTSAAT